MFPDKGQQLAEKIGAYYYETSVLVPFGVDCLFTNCIRAALTSKRSRNVWSVLGSTSGCSKHVRSPANQHPFLPPRPAPPAIRVDADATRWCLGVWQTKLSGQHCDVTFLFADGRTIAGHRGLLISTCASFRRLFLRRRDLPLFKLDVAAPVDPCGDLDPGAGEIASPPGDDLPRSSPYLRRRAVSRCTVPARCPTDHLPGVDVVLVDSSVAPVTLDLLLRYLYTDDYAGEFAAEVETLSRSLYLHEFVDKICCWAYYSDLANVARSREYARANNYSHLLLDQDLFAGLCPHSA